MKKFIGTGVALVTPFTEELEVDFEALKKLVRFNIDNGINYLVINGTTAESATITTQEKLEIITTIAKENNGKVPLVLGVGGNNTKNVIDELKTLDLTHIDAVLSVAPYYTKPTQEGFYQHYKAIATTTNKAIILYNVPGRTSKNILPQTVIRLANEFDNIIGIKEASGNQNQYYQLLKDKPNDFLIISGDDDLALGAVLAGGAGVISVIGQAYPKEFSTMINLGLAGKNKEAFAIHYQLMNMVSYIFEENNPAGIKALLNRIGICLDEVRLPLVRASENLQTKISDFVKQF